MTGRLRAFQAEGTAWTSEFLGGAEYRVSETSQVLNKVPRTQMPDKLPGFSPVVSGLALHQTPHLGSGDLASTHTSIL